MARIVKQPDVRKAEIVNISQRLFYQRGFENTSVNEIVQTAGIAKGTFYHYFRSKSDVIDEIIEKYLTQIADEILFELENNLSSPIEKLNYFFFSAGFFKPTNKMVTTILVKLIFMEENVLIKEKMLKTYINSINPLLSKIVSQLPGWENESDEKVSYTAEFLLLAYLHLSEELSNMLLDKILSEKERELIIGKSASFAEAAEKILGTGNNSIQLMKDELIDKYFEIFSNL